MPFKGGGEEALGRGLRQALLPQPPTGQFEELWGLEEIISAFGVSVVQLKNGNYEDSTHPPGEVVRSGGS